MYQTIGYLVRNVGGFYACTDLHGQWISAMTDNLEHLQSSHVRMLVRHVFIPLVRCCPLESRYSNCKRWKVVFLCFFKCFICGRLRRGMSLGQVWQRLWNISNLVMHLHVQHGSCYNSHLRHPDQICQSNCACISEGLYNKVEIQG